jgi:hypothetical protein
LQRGLRACGPAPLETAACPDDERCVTKKLQNDGAAIGKVA